MTSELQANRLSCPRSPPVLRSPAAMGPILDTHIHLYARDRLAGAPWPPPSAARLHRDVLPAEYKALAARHGVVGAGIIEASPRPDENRWVLDLVRGDAFFPFFVAALDLGARDAADELALLAADQRVVGVRSFLWGAPITLDQTQRANLRALAARGMTLDLISRGALNPKDRVAALAAAAPDLRIVIDHLAGARGRTPDPAWARDVRRLAAAHPNLHLKLSSLFDMWNPADDETTPWDSPADLDAYRPHLHVLLEAFGEDRLVFGSNWPVCEQGGGFALQLALVEQFLAPLGPRARDKVMHANARALYVSS